MIAVSPPRDSASDPAALHRIQHSSFHNFQSLQGEGSTPHCNNQPQLSFYNFQSLKGEGSTPGEGAMLGGDLFLLHLAPPSPSPPRPCSSKKHRHSEPTLVGPRREPAEVVVVPKTPLLAKSFD